MVSSRFFALIFLSLLCSPDGAQAGSAKCEDLKSQTASVTVGFSYGAVGQITPALPRAQNDAQRFFKIGQTVSGDAKILRDADLKSGQNPKAAFLAALKAQIGDKKYVNFNYTGHGTHTKDGEYAIVLPGIPYEDARYCKNLSDCPASEKYMVTSSELKEVFAGKKVFGFNDSCESGALDLGPDSMMMNATQGKEEASDVNSFSKQLESDLSGDKSCSYDLDHDGDISLGELARKFPYEKAGSESLQGLDARWGQKRSLVYGKDEGGIAAKQTPTRTGARGAEWSSCIKLKTTPESCPGGATRDGSPAGKNAGSRR